MFKTDKKSLEKLSFGFDGRDISNLDKVMKYLKYNDLLTISQKDYQEAIEGLKEINNLKLNGKVYAFCVNDSLGPKYNGVELFLRQGNKLEDIYSSQCRGEVCIAQDAIDFLKKENVSKVYTGKIGNEFLGIPCNSDVEDPFLTGILDKNQINQFKEEGIEVIILDSLF